MTLRTKSILIEPSKEDGLRICIMRIIKPNYQFDIWWRELSPSLNLLMSYKNSQIDWGEYVFRYKKEVLIPHRENINLLSDIAVKKDITLLCIEKIPEYCHRRLLAEECKKYNSNLELIIK